MSIATKSTCARAGFTSEIKTVGPYLKMKDAEEFANNLGYPINPVFSINLW